MCYGDHRGLQWSQEWIRGGLFWGFFFGRGCPRDAGVSLGGDWWGLGVTRQLWRPREGLQGLGGNGRGGHEAHRRGLQGSWGSQGGYGSPRRGWAALWG